MRSFYKKYFFSKHILVNDSVSGCENNFHALFSLARVLGINITKGKNLANLEVFKFATSEIGKKVQDSFYLGFPESVKNLTKEQLLFDQLLHYFKTYTLGDFSAEEKRSLMEEDFKRIAFREHTTPVDFEIIKEEDAVKQLEEIVSNLLCSSRPLSNLNYQLVKNFVIDFNFNVEKCNCKDTIIRLLIDTKDLSLANQINFSDIIRVVEYINYLKYKNENIKNLNLKNQDRKLITKILDLKLEKETNIKECFEKQAIWCGILHHIHYKPKTEIGKNFVEKMRGGINDSVYSNFENLLKEKQIKKAIDYLIRQKGVNSLVRKLSYIISRCENEEQIKYALSKIETKNNIVLIQNLLHYKNVKKLNRSFVFTKFNKLKTHTETKKEVEKRKSVTNEQTAKTICEILKQNLRNNLKNKLARVYIHPSMSKIALPIQENTSNGGFNVLPKGSKIEIEKLKKIRAFIYWKKVNDIDLSAIGLTEDLEMEEFSWRSMFDRQSDGITFSGDVVNGFNGASEYFDINLPKFKKTYPKVRYLIFCDNVYSSLPFSEVVCRAGYMLRDEQDSGQVFEPKTVKSSFTINCDSTFAYMFGIDLKTNEFVWLNTSRNSSVIVAGQTSVGFLLEYFERTKVFNVGNFFEMMATQIVDDPALADVVVCDDINVQTKQDALVIKSFDFEKITALLQ